MTIMQKTKQKNTKGMPEIVCFFAFGKKLNEMTHMGRFHRPRVGLTKFNRTV